MTGADQRSAQTLHYNFTIQNMLSAHERELYELTQISGIKIDPQVFKILLELLQLDVSPAAVFSMLQNMTGQQSTKTGVSGSKKVALGKSSSQPAGKKKPPIAAKPKRTSSENH